MAKGELRITICEREGERSSGLETQELSKI